MVESFPIRRTTYLLSRRLLYRMPGYTRWKYLAFAAAYAFVLAVPAEIARPFGWLPRIGLAGYALTTIGAYLVSGGFFTLGWITKGIEVAIVGLVFVDLLMEFWPRRGPRHA